MRNIKSAVMQIENSSVSNLNENLVFSWKTVHITIAFFISFIEFWVIP